MPSRSRSNSRSNTETDDTEIGPLPDLPRNKFDHRPSWQSVERSYEHTNGIRRKRRLTHDEALVTRPDSATRLNVQTEEHPMKLYWRDRLRHFTWTWFTMTMATGGIANVIYNVPSTLRFNGLYYIGVFFFLLNIVLFLFNCVMMGLRFYFWPVTRRTSILHPTESLFVPAFVISIAVILMNITQYGFAHGKTGPWLAATMTVFYWIYIAFAVLFTCGFYLLMWSTQTFTISQMTPVWIFPAYPLLLVGPFAAALTTKTSGIPNDRSLQIIIGGVIVVGVGFIVSLMVYSSYMYRLMTQKLPPETSRPAMFISVGPSGFTISGIVTLGHNLPSVIDSSFFGNGELAGQVSKILANWMGIWLWGLAVFFFLVSVGAHWSCFQTKRQFKFAMTWNAFIFPNTGLATATFAIAKALDNNTGFAVLACVMGVALVAMWLFVFGMMIRAVILRQILWPQEQEDRDADVWLRDKKGRVLKGEDIEGRDSFRGRAPSRPNDSDAVDHATHGVDGDGDGGSGNGVLTAGLPPERPSPNHSTEPRSPRSTV